MDVKDNRWWMALSYLELVLLGLSSRCRVQEIDSENLEKNVSKMALFVSFPNSM